MTDTAATINQLIEALLLIHRIARRALSDEERVGQRIQRNPRGELDGLLVQMSTIEMLARGGLPKELLDLVVAKDRVSRDPRRGAGDRRVGAINQIILAEVLRDLSSLS